MSLLEFDDYDENVDVEFHQSAGVDGIVDDWMEAIDNMDRDDGDGRGRGGGGDDNDNDNRNDFVDRSNNSEQINAPASFICFPAGSPAYVRRVCLRIRASLSIRTIRIVFSLYFSANRWFLICDQNDCRRVVDMSVKALHAHFRSFHTPNPFASRCAVCEHVVDAYQLVTHLRLHGTQSDGRLPAIQTASATDDDFIAAYAAHLQRRSIAADRLAERRGAAAAAINRLSTLLSVLQRLRPVGVDFLPASHAQQPLPFVDIESGFMW